MLCVINKENKLINNINDFIDTDDKDCRIVLKFQLEEQRSAQYTQQYKEHEYIFVDNIRVADYVKIRYYLVLLSSIGIDENDNIAVTYTDKYKVASLGLFYWFNVLRKKIGVENMNPFILDKEIKKIKLTNIYVYYKDFCIDCIEVDQHN